jgi:hypothetical protein
MGVNAKFAKRSICPCGFPVLADEIPLGTMYVVRSGISARLSFSCGGCHQIHDVSCVYVEARGKSKGGYLPAEIFDIDEGLEGQTGTCCILKDDGKVCGVPVFGGDVACADCCDGLERLLNQKYAEKVLKDRRN